MFPNALPSSLRFELCVVAGAWGQHGKGEAERDHFPCPGFTGLRFQSLRQTQTQAPGGSHGCRWGWGSGRALGVTQRCSFTVALESETASLATVAEHAPGCLQKPRSICPERRRRKSTAQNQPMAPHFPGRILEREAECWTPAFRDEPLVLGPYLRGE